MNHEVGLTFTPVSDRKRTWQWVATKVALQQVQPVTVVWLRFAMGVIILGLGMVIRRQFA